MLKPAMFAFINQLDYFFFVFFFIFDTVASQDT